MRLKPLLFAPALTLLAAPAWPAGFAWPFSASPPPQPARPAVGFPFSGFATPPATPFGSSGYGPSYGSPFSLFSGAASPTGGFGGASMGSMLSPLMSGATSFMMPFAGNYMIASMNPTTMTNFMGLMMNPQGSPFGSPFGGGFSFFPSPTAGTFPGFGAPAQPAAPFSFFPGFRR